MHIAIAGGRGFLGTPLSLALAAQGHAVVVLTRSGASGSPAPAPGRVATAHWSPEDPAGAWASAIDLADVVVNLAGESIAGHRWTAEHKARIRDSRIPVTLSLAAALRSRGGPPKVFISASGAGYYGDRGDELLDEQASAGRDFLARLAQEWEHAALQAADAARVVLIRTGIVLAKSGGALQEMARPFRLGAGGPLGSGRQYMSWIHLTDWVSLVCWAIRTAAVAGPLNATAPNPVTNEQFSRELGHALHRPALLRTPAFALRLVLGEMADSLLLTGQRAVPAKARALGFDFAYPDLGPALADLFS
jgi:uncharacterized protein